MITANSDWSTRWRSLQQAREERPGPQLRDLQLQITRRGGQRPGSVAVALGDAGVAALVQAHADHRAQLGL
jgi:hypothetical protein